MGTPPEGSNDWSCKPSAAHPRPVVLVHGTLMSMQDTFPVLSPQLKAQGYCVFALNYGGIPTWFDPKQIVWGTADIAKSASELSTFVDAVLQHTGATQVDLVGHSQGGLMPRQYLKFNGGADPQDPSKNKVHSLVALGPTNHGTTFDGQQQLFSIAAQLGLTNLSGFSNEQVAEAVFGVSRRQQLVGSPFVKKINAGSETEPGVDYTVIATKYDSVVTPPEGSFLAPSSDGSVKNVWLQDGCPTDQAGHAQLLQDPRAIYLVQAVLDPSYAQSHAEPCP